MARTDHETAVTLLDVVGTSSLEAVTSGAVEVTSDAALVT